MNIKEAMQYIQGFSKSGKPVKDLSRIKSLLDELGNPQDSLNIVHIAGTNGKGSVLAFCSAASIEAGFKTGQFTSPYIRHYRDRIRINGEDIPEDRLCALCERVSACKVSAACSQFEISFAIALLYFQEEKCELVFLETGLGGLLDATNVVKSPLVCAITSISFDHTAILGETIYEIASQKAGIIKAGCPVVLSADNSSYVSGIVEGVAEKKHSEFYMPSMRDCIILDETLTGTTFQYYSMKYTLNMPGKHQVYNAITAIEVIRILAMHGFLIPANIVQSAFASVKVSARIQMLQKEPPVLLDGGHNQSGIMALADVIMNSKCKTVIGIFGMMKSKDYISACRILKQELDIVFCVDDFSSDAVPAEELASYFSSSCETICMPFSESYKLALEKAKQMNGLIVISGSLYLASEFLNDGEDAL